jgi:hypothetical protein
LEGKVLTTWAPNYRLRINNKQAVRIFRCFVRKKEEAKTNPKKALTDNMKVSLAELIEKRDNQTSSWCDNSFGRRVLEMFFGSEETTP